MKSSALTSAVVLLSLASAAVMAAAVAAFLIDAGPCHDSPPSQRIPMWVAIAVAFTFWAIGLALVANCSRRAQQILVGVAVADVVAVMSVLALYSHQMTLYYNCG